MHYTERNKRMKSSEDLKNNNNTNNKSNSNNNNNNSNNSLSAVDGRTRLRSVEDSSLVNKITITNNKNFNNCHEKLFTDLFFYLLFYVCANVYVSVYILWCVSCLCVVWCGESYSIPREWESIVQRKREISSKSETR